MDHNIRPLTQIELIAKTCHEVNRAYCAGLGDHSHLPWESTPQIIRDSVLSGVQLHLDAGEAGLPPGTSHQAWLDYKVKEGWVWGPTKDVDFKMHPNLVPFHQLPYQEQVKDHLFGLTVRALRNKA